VQDFRVDERERQRASRARRRQRLDEASSHAAGHAPASGARVAKWVRTLLSAWDEAVALSRAGLERKVTVILRE